MTRSPAAGSPRQRAWPPAALRAWWPARATVDGRERLRVAAGALLGVTLAALLCQALALAWPGPFNPAGLPWLVASTGASAVLVFALPGSPLAQPWAVVGGNTVSALVGLLCVMALGQTPWVMGLAVGLAILTMFALRCLHPPGGASALMMVVAGATQPRLVLFPVLVNMLLLVAAGVAWARLTGRRYPQSQQFATPPAPGPGAAATPGAPPEPEEAQDDLQAILSRLNHVVDIGPEELGELVALSRLQAWRHQLGRLRCGDVMSRNPVTVHFGTPLDEAWRLLRSHHIKALPVIDRARRVVGILTLADFLRPEALDEHSGWSQRFKALIRPSQGSHSDKPEVVGQLMTRQVRVASASRPLADLVQMFSQGGHHHLPVIDDERRLVGILTQTDMVAAIAGADAQPSV